MGKTNNFREIDLSIKKTREINLHQTPSLLFEKFSLKIKRK